MNILCADTHEAYQTDLAMTGHTFFSLQNPAFKTWDVTNRPLPDNYYQVCDVPDNIDCVISQNRVGQYQILGSVARKRDIPLITIEHCLPLPEWPEEYIKQFAGMRGDIDVVNTHHSLSAWLYDNTERTRVIPPGVDTEFFKGWIGGDPRPLTIISDFINRDEFCGYGLWKRVTKNMGVNLWGNTPGLSVHTKDVNHLLGLYQHAALYFNPTLRSSFGYTVIEAMSVGCPIVTTKNGPLPDMVIDGYNGYCSNDEDYLRTKILEIINNPDLARELGENGRTMAINVFNRRKFIDKWSQLLLEVVK